MNLKQLFNFCEIRIEDHPELHSKIKDLYELARDEVEYGESETHECELAVDEIEELIKET